MKGGRWVRGVDALVKELGMVVQPKQVLLIYGQPMVGKSTLAAILARWWAQGHDSNVVVLGLETAYGEEEYVEFISQYLKGVKFRIVTFDTVQNAMSSVLRRAYMGLVHGAGAVILDSVSAFGDALASDLVAKMGTVEQRVVAARVSPIIKYVVMGVREVAVRRGGIGIVIAHAGSTAGTSKYRGLTDWRPSLSIKAGHYVSYELLLEVWEKKPEYRTLTIVAARNRPWLDGNSVLMRFAENDVEVYTKGEEK